MNERLKELIFKYEQNKEHYLSKTYNETQLRTDFLNPFLEILGWDIQNSSGKTTNEREVLVEEGLKQGASQNTKKPDYTFRLFSERKFFLEAKKPSVKIHEDNESAKQVRRYGFTAKLKISVLSNFEYLAIYDCSKIVNEKDLYNNSRIKIYHYSQYIDNFDEIMNYIGKQSVYSGNFDSVWSQIEEQLKLFSVDNLFLNQINSWRLILGKEIFSHKKDITDSLLNDLVQSYINSLIFLRVCEDRNLEDYKTLLELATKEDFESLLKKFKNADKKYNSGLFNHSLNQEIIQNNKSAFWDIIKQLYYPESPYSFSVFSSEILGNIYEIFLGQKLVFRDGYIKLEKKPENIERDIVTTPSFIIKNILRKTVYEYCKDKTDEDIFQSSFADISCGSGAFLLETYQLVNDILVDYYVKLEKTDSLVQTSINTFKLPFSLKKKILKNCIFGVDKDYNAVEACKFALLLKLLEEENNSTIDIPALPDISTNINFGNSLIEHSFIKSSDLHNNINPFSFSKKYDVIIGNPPYMTIEDMKKYIPKEIPLYKEKYISSTKQYDKYFLFIERGISLLKEGGYLGYIVPNKFVKIEAAKKLRQFLKDTKFIKEIVSFGANQVFQDKTTYTCLIILQKNKLDSFLYLEVKNLSKWLTRDENEFIPDSMSIDNLNNEVWFLVPKYLRNAFSKINSSSIDLESLVGEDNIYNGIQTSANPIYIHTFSHEDNQYYYFKKDNIDWNIEKDLTRPYYKTIKSKTENLNTYRLLVPNSFVIYPYKKIDNKITFVDIDTLSNSYPYLFKYLMHYKNVLNSPSRDIQPKPENEDEWYRYGRHQCLENCDVKQKIVVGVLSQGNKYALDFNRTLISSGGTAGYCMITLPEDFNYSIYYIQALLNSKYVEWYSSLIGEVFRGGYIARGTKVLKKLPIIKIDFNNKASVDLHNNISSCQEDLISIQSEIDSNKNDKRKQTILIRSFNSKKVELDTFLTTLFNLGEDDKLIPLISEVYAIN